MCYKGVRVIFYLETWSSPDMTRSLIGQLLMSYTICFPTKRRIETVPPAEDFHEDTLRKIGSTIYSPTSRKKEVCLSVCLRPVCISPCLKYLFVCLLFCGCVQQCAAQSGHLVIGSMAPATHRIKHPTTNLKGEKVFRYF